MKRFNLQEKQAFIAFRVILSLLLLFFGVYAPSGRMDLLANPNMLYWLLGVVGIQFASNLILAWVPSRLIRKGWGLGFFLMDLGVVSLAVCWTQGFESDLFLIYFLVIFMTALARKPAVSFAVAGLSCILYGFLFLKTGSTEDLFQPSVLIRFPLFWVTAFFSSVLVDDLEEEKKKMAGEMEDQWARSEKLAALGQLAKSVAQELNNPLTSIIGMSQMLLSRGGEFEEDARIIERNAQRCKVIASDLENFSAGEPLGLEPLDMREVLEGTADLLRDQLRRASVAVQLNFDPDPANRWVQGSAPHLRQAFFNLVLNAVQAMPLGGTLALGIHKKSSLNERNIPRDFVEVTVEDSGCGISKDVLERFAGPGLARWTAGSQGFGLAVAKNLIERHNGKIGIENRGSGGGARVWMRLPSGAALTGGVRHGIHEFAAV